MKRIIAALALALAAACAALPPQTDPLAQLQGQVIAVRKTCIDLLNRDRLTVEGGTKCLLTTNQASDAIGIVRLGGAADLESARNALIELERYLQGQIK